MKNLIWKMVGIITIGAVMGFGLAGCPDDGGGLLGPSDTTVAGTALALDSLVTAPAAGGTPTQAIDAAQYTGMVAWQKADNTAHTGTFAAGTVYKALVTLTAKTGYTFSGVAQNAFSHTGATTVDNDANSGTVTISFTQTQAANAGIPIGNPSVTLYLNGNPLAHNGSTPITAGNGTYTVSIAPGAYSSIVWYFNGTPVSVAENQESITLSNKSAGTYLLNVEATTGSTKNSGAHTFVVGY